MGEVSLEQVLAQARSGLPLPVACWLIARVAEALASAPRVVTAGEVRIAEHGEVHLAPPRPGRTPFAYLAPEVVRGGDPDERSAVFGLGALLVEAITGSSPFARDSEMETRLAVSEDPAPVLHGRVAEASHELDAIVQRALAKQPAGRFAAMAELAARLDTFLSDELHDASADHLGAAVRAVMSGGDPAEARPPRGFAPSEHNAPLGEPKLTVPADAPARARPTPAPGSIEPPSPSTPARSKRTPPPGIIQPAAPSSAAPRSKRTPPPGIIQPAARSKPAQSKPSPPKPPPPKRPADPNYEDAELDIGPLAQRASHPGKPKLDQDLVRLGDPLPMQAGAGITDAAVTGIDQRRTPARSRPAPMLLVDEEAIRRERMRPATVAPDEEPEPPGPNWLLRVVVILLSLLALALAYQFALRPLLK